MSEKIVISQLNLQTPIDLWTIAKETNAVYSQGYTYDLNSDLTPKLFAFAEYGMGEIIADAFSYVFQKKVAENA